MKQAIISFIVLVLALVNYYIAYYRIELIVNDDFYIIAYEEDITTWFLLLAVFAVFVVHMIPIVKRTLTRIVRSKS